MTGPEELAALLAPLRAHPERTALLFDFDGTLSPTVADPAAATALPGVVPRLAELATTYAVVAAVSGRPVAFLAAQLPPSVQLSGLYGLETRLDGIVGGHAEAARWRPAIAEAARRAAERSAPGSALHGLVVEAKGLSLTLHVRTHPELADESVALAHDLAAEAGLEVRPAKMSVELHPPLAVDKGTAVRSLVGAARCALFVGDDVGDLPGFAALAELRTEGALDVARSIAVGGAELPAEVRERADLVLPAQADVLSVLDALRLEGPGSAPA